MLRLFSSFEIEHAEKISEWSGRLVSWLTSVLVILICFDVSMRYIANETAVWVQELEWHLFSLIFLIGAAYTLQHDSHVRVDVFYARFSPKRKAWINLIGTLLFLLPFCFMMIRTTYGYAMRAYSIGEASPDPGGLPFRFLIKGAMVLGFVLLIFQAFIEAWKALRVILGKGEHEHLNQEQTAAP